MRTRRRRCRPTTSRCHPTSMCACWKNGARSFQQSQTSVFFLQFLLLPSHSIQQRRVVPPRHAVTRPTQCPAAQTDSVTHPPSPPVPEYIFFLSTAPSTCGSLNPAPRSHVGGRHPHLAAGSTYTKKYQPPSKTIQGTSPKRRGRDSHTCTARTLTRTRHLYTRPRRRASHTSPRVPLPIRSPASNPTPATEAKGSG